MFPFIDEDQCFKSQDRAKTLSSISLMWLVNISRFVLSNRQSQELDLKALHNVELCRVVSFTPLILCRMR